MTPLEWALFLLWLPLAFRLCRRYDKPAERHTPRSPWEIWP